jgi:predicted SprT family Zn-dependent metalloprotease
VNEKMLNCPPSQAALTAIITHELSHFQDYHSLPILGVTKLGIRYGASKKFRRYYERQTDWKTLELGHGPGLSEYREWLYKMLPPKAVKTKKYYYLTPEEIAAGRELP